MAQMQENNAQGKQKGINFGEWKLSNVKCVVVNHPLSLGRSNPFAEIERSFSQVKFFICILSRWCLSSRPLRPVGPSV